MLFSVLVFPIVVSVVVFGEAETGDTVAVDFWVIVANGAALEFDFPMTVVSVVLLIFSEARKSAAEDFEVMAEDVVDVRLRVKVELD